MFWVDARIIQVENEVVALIDGMETILLFENLHFELNEEVKLLVDDVVLLSLPPKRQVYDKRRKDCMLFNLVELKKNFEGKFTRDDLNCLEEIERTLRYEKFGSDEAVELGIKLYEKAKKHGDIAIRITRESDKLPIFQLVMDVKKQRNIDFGEAKRNVVLKTGHCSMWGIVKECVDGGLDFFTEESDCLPGGGGWPIYVGDEMVATLFVSGLHEGLDQILIVEALTEVLKKDIPEYKGLVF